MTPELDIDGGWGTALVRGLAIGTVMWLWGTLLYRATIRDEARRLTRAVLVAGVGATLLWIAVESSRLGGVASLPELLAGTAFGHVLLTRLALLALCGAALLARRVPLAALFAALAAATEGGVSHAEAMIPGPSLLLASTTLHVLAAGAWLGALPPLYVTLRTAPIAEASRAARRFAWLGTAAVLVLLATSAENFAALIGGLPGLIGTGHGLVALVKMALFAALLWLAAANAFRLTPALRRDAPQAARGRLLRNVGAEILLGLLAVLAAGVLASVEPAMHAEPVWPFSVVPSFAAWREDPDLHPELLAAAAATALGIVAFGLALVVRRLRGAVLGALGVVLVAFAAPHLRPLLMPAVPTQFFRSPTGYTADAITAGATLFARNCTGCHGAAGRGDGPLAASLALPPADLTAPHLLEHADGELFWWLTHGIEGPAGSLAMPGFGTTLDETARWGLIDYLRAHNRGLGFAAGGAPPPAPDFDLTCTGAAAETLGALRGRMAALWFGAAHANLSPDLVSIGGAPPASCVATDPATVAAAYALAAGRADVPNSGYALIDAAGLLRAFNPARDASPTPQDLADLARPAPAAPPAEDMEDMPGMGDMTAHGAK